MKHLRGYNENNNTELIRKLESFGIKNYTINPDNSIDVNGDVDLLGKDLKEIPFNFRNVSCSFDCSDNKLTSLKGCPKEVGGYFSCSNNNLKDLIGGPQYLYGSYYCHHNCLETLEGCAGDIKGNLYCTFTKLKELDCSSVIEGDIYCTDNGFKEEPYFYGVVGKKIVWEPHSFWYK